MMIRADTSNVEILITMKELKIKKFLKNVGWYPREDSCGGPICQIEYLVRATISFTFTYFFS